MSSTHDNAGYLVWVFAAALLLAGCGTVTEPRPDYRECRNDRNAGAICIRYMLCTAEDCDDAR